MNPSELLTQFATVAETIRQLTLISKSFGDTDAKLALANVHNQLADVNIELATLKTKMAELINENLELRIELKELKLASESSTPEMTLKGDLYFDKSGDGPFCTACFDTTRKPIRVVAQNPMFDDFGKHRCPICKTHYQS